MMLDGSLYLTSSDGANSLNDEAWFMNRVSKSGIAKTPMKVLQGGKQRSIEDILGYCLSTCKSQNRTQLCSAGDDRRDGLHDISSDKLKACISAKAWAQLFMDEDNEEIEDPVEPVSANDSHPISSLGTLPRKDSETPSVGMELLLEDSTSNSSDSMSFKGDFAGIPPSGSANGGCLYGKSEDVPCRHKRVSMKYDTQDAEDDEWTLQKWQKFYQKKHSGSKRLKRVCKVEHEFSVGNGEVCSGSPLEQIGTHYGTSGINSPLLELSQGTTESVEVMIGNREADSTDHQLHEGGGVSVKDPLHSIGKSYCKDSSQMSASCHPHSTVRLELEDESEVGTTETSLSARVQKSAISGWSLRPCDRGVTTVRPVALSQGVLDPCRKAAQLSYATPERACVEVIGQRKQFEDMASLLPGNVPGSIQHDTKTLVHCMDGDGKPKAVLSEESRDCYAKQLHVSTDKDFSNLHTAQLDSALHFVMDNSISQSNSKVRHVSATSLKCSETFDIEEEPEPLLKPAKIPCKRKAISPMSQEFLLKASKLGEFGADAESRGWKRLPLVSNEGWVDLHMWRKKELSCDTLVANDRNGYEGISLQEEGQDYTALPPDAVVVASTTSSDSPAQGMKISLVAPNSQSNQQNPRSKLSMATSPSGASPLMPTKGILRLSCQGPCGCEECTALRFRAERASEFSQRQMLDIEGLAVKLMKDLSILRRVVEDRLLQTSANKHQSPRPILSLEQVKKATLSAAETEETAKKWLIRMARDCNRYCKIMRMQGRKLSFADESGGKLCHVRMFHSEPRMDVTTHLHGGPLESNVITPSTPNEPAMEVISSTESASVHERPLDSNDIFPSTPEERAMDVILSTEV